MRGLYVAGGWGQVSPVVDAGGGIYGLWGLNFDTWLQSRFSRLSSLVARDTLQTSFLLGVAALALLSAPTRWDIKPSVADLFKNKIFERLIELLYSIARTPRNTANASTGAIKIDLLQMKYINHTIVLCKASHLIHCYTETILVSLLLHDPEQTFAARGAASLACSLQS
ncbi:Uncharacterized protein Fot_02245 [Forsythia ovata]|uniref:Uncharacterized protein n=1 Tax=Forsythia ovata TaxID=205694 RepID=A0ABD1X6A5_9LAMI